MLHARRHRAHLYIIDFTFAAIIIDVKGAQNQKHSNQHGMAT